ncbi:hypothetical protein AB00_2272 [Raoultella ornithinolytica 2-156-04_S1_C1]|nr:hypothetical protein AB00_2272 [Raoultella ornithinolytica 2-156-04_S1_C1]
MVNSFVIYCVAIIGRGYKQRNQRIALSICGKGIYRVGEIFYVGNSRRNAFMPDGQRHETASP